VAQLTKGNEQAALALVLLGTSSAHPVCRQAGVPHLCCCCCCLLALLCCLLGAIALAPLAPAAGWLLNCGCARAGPTTFQRWRCGAVLAGCLARGCVVFSVRCCFAVGGGAWCSFTYAVVTCCTTAHQLLPLAALPLPLHAVAACYMTCTSCTAKRACSAFHPLLEVLVVGARACLSSLIADGG
jgi:hypothetical protein